MPEQQMIRALRTAIAKDSRSLTEIAEDAEIGVPILSRFMQARRSMTLRSAAAVAESLGLVLVSGKTSSASEAEV